MKKTKLVTLSLFVFAVLFSPFCLKAQDKDDQKLMDDCYKGKEAFIKANENMKTLFDNSYAYVLFPNIGKGAVGVGGAAGNGIAYEGGKVVGKAKMKQVTVGFQLGGQVYQEVIFFENAVEFDKFKKGNFEFSAQASAVAVTKGASMDANFKNGVMVYTKEKKGAMYEASIGGQKFSYTAFAPAAGG